MSWKNLPIELVHKILIEFDGRFVLRKRKLIFIDKLLKDDERYSMLSRIIPHPGLRPLSTRTFSRTRVFVPSSVFAIFKGKTIFTFTMV